MLISKKFMVCRLFFEKEDRYVAAKGIEPAITIQSNPALFSVQKMISKATKYMHSMF